MTWVNPEWFWALTLLPFLALLQYWHYRKRRLAQVVYSDVSDLKKLPGNWRSIGNWLTYVTQLLSIVLIIVALARPQMRNTVIERFAEGIDIMLVIDISSSMLAEDLKPNRLIAVKNVAEEFVNRRQNDRIGLTVFAREAITLVPPTLDYRLVRQQLRTLDLGIVKDGTAIGVGVATAVNRLRNSEAESKVIVLLTDGENNAGEIDPITSAQLARTYNIRMYTIGASTEGTAPYPVEDPVFGRRYFNIRVDIDEPMLTEMAEMTGGRYFRARDTDGLRRVYSEIDELERTEIEEIIYIDRKELYYQFLFPGILFLTLSIFFDRFLFRMDLA
ncbi:MAG: VWA domain-containing protein [Balneolaceae bacterium]|jgi:Ca-activated chloride channel family protein|nr:MAG: VWA domain-containing protein [Balneolaceae bacterium]